MSYYGDFRPGQTVRIRFNTINLSGVPTTLSSGTVTVSKDGSDVTPSGGVTLTTDAGGVTGRHHVVIDTSVDATTFTAGAEYAVRLAGTSNVGGTSVVGVVLGEWSIANRSVQVNSAGNALVDVQTIKSQTVTAAAGVTFPTSILGVATDVSGAAVPGSAGAAMRSVNDNLAGLVTTVGVAGAGLTAIPKTGYKLASDGLDSISTTAPSGVASNFREMMVQVWRRFFRKTTKTSSQIKTYADDGTTVTTTQAISNDGTTQTQGAAS